MNQKKVQQYILGLPGVERSYLNNRKIAVYTVNGEDLAMIEVGKTPLRLSLRCDEGLANILKERYEEVMPGYKLNKAKWITVVMSGQLDLAQIEGLIDHSYQLVIRSV